MSLESEDELVESRFRREDIGKLGSVRASDDLDRNLFENTSVRFIDGDVEAGEVASDSQFDFVLGDVSGQKMFNNLNNSVIWGDLLASGDYFDTAGSDKDRNYIFSYSSWNTVVGSRVEGRTFGDISPGNLILADEVNVEDDLDDSLIITDQAEDNYTTFTGDDFEGFKREVLKREEDIIGVPLISPDLDEIGSTEEFFELEESLREDIDGRLDEYSHDEIAGGLKMKSFMPEFPDRDSYIDFIEYYIKHSDYPVTQDEMGFGEALKEIPRDSSDDFIELLHDGGHFPMDFERMAKYSSPYGTKEESDEIQAIIDGWMMPEPDAENPEENDILEDLLDNFEGEISSIYSLAEELDKDHDFLTFDWVRKNIDRDDVEEEAFRHISQEIEALQDERLEWMIDMFERMGERQSLIKKGHNYVLSPVNPGEEASDEYIVFEGEMDEWDDFRERLDVDGSYSFEGFERDPYWMHVFGRSLDGPESVEDIIEAEEEVLEDIEAVVGDFDEEYAREVVNKVGLPDLPDRFQMQYLSALVELPEKDQTSRERIEEFNSVLDELDDDLREDLFEILKTEEDEAFEENENYDFSYSGDSKFGRSLVNIAKGREFSELTYLDETLHVREMVEGEPPSEYDLDDLVQVSDRLWVERPEWADNLQQIYEDNKEDIAHVARLSEFAGENFNYDDIEKSKLLKWAFDPNQDKDVDWDSIRKEVEDKIENQKRDRLKKVLQRYGWQFVEDNYEEATGETIEEEDIQDEHIGALKVRRNTKRGRGEREDVDTLLKHEDDVYKLPENQRWLENHELDADEIMDPEISDFDEEMFNKADDYDQESALRADITPEDAESDIENERRQYLEEMKDLISSLGLEEAAEKLDAESSGKIEDEILNEVKEKVKEYRTENDGVERADEALDVIQNYRSVDKRASGLPDHLTFRVASPFETVLMGEGLGSCHDVENSYGWAAVGNALDANKMVFYAEDEEGELRARSKGFLTEEDGELDKMVYFNTSRYKDINLDTSEYFLEYMNQISDELGVELVHSSDIDNYNVQGLEANRTYIGG